MILVHKGRKAPGPLEASPIPWPVYMWLQSQMHVIGDKELSPGDLVIKVLEKLEKICGTRRSALSLLDEMGGSTVDILIENTNLRGRVRDLTTELEGHRAQEEKRREH